MPTRPMETRTVRVPRDPGGTATFAPWPPGQSPMTLGAAGLLPNAMDLIASGNFAPTAAKGFARDLGPLSARSRLDPKPFFPAALEAMAFKGTQFALPYLAHPGYSTYWANADSLQQAGVAEPDDATWTWAQAAAVRLVRRVAGRGAGKQCGMATPTEVQQVTVATRAHGGNVLDRDGWRSLVAEPAFAAGVQWIADVILRDRGAPPPGTLTEAPAQSLVRGRWP